MEIIRPVPSSASDNEHFFFARRNVLVFVRWHKGGAKQQFYLLSERPNFFATCDFVARLGPHRTLEPISLCFSECSTWFWPIQHLFEFPSLCSTIGVKTSLTKNSRIPWPEWRAKPWFFSQHSRLHVLLSWAASIPDTETLKLHSRLPPNEDRWTLATACATNKADSCLSLAFRLRQTCTISCYWRKEKHLSLKWTKPAHVTQVGLNFSLISGKAKECNASFLVREKRCIRKQAVIWLASFCRQQRERSLFCVNPGNFGVGELRMKLSGGCMVHQGGTDAPLTHDKTMHIWAEIEFAWRTEKRPTAAVSHRATFGVFGCQTLVWLGIFWLLCDYDLRLNIKFFEKRIWLSVRESAETACGNLLKSWGPRHTLVGNNHCTQGQSFDSTQTKYPGLVPEQTLKQQNKCRLPPLWLLWSAGSKSGPDAPDGESCACGPSCKCGDSCPGKKQTSDGKDCCKSNSFFVWWKKPFFAALACFCFFLVMFRVFFRNSLLLFCLSLCWILQVGRASAAKAGRSASVHQMNAANKETTAWNFLRVGHETETIYQTSCSCVSNSS